MTDVIVERDVCLTTRDGVGLSANVYRPATEGRYPVLVKRLPYGKDVLQTAQIVLDPVRAASAGFAVVIQDCRGRFGSSGVFEPFSDEFDDGFDTIEWAAVQPWSNGEVGVYGVSYSGATAWAAASSTSAALRAVAASQSPLDHHALFWRAGAFELGAFLFWVVRFLAIPELLRLRAGAPTLTAELAELVAVVDDFEDSADRFERGELRLGPADEKIFPYFEEFLRGDPEYHRLHSAGDRLEQVAVPALVTAGWHDFLLRQDLATFARLRARPSGDPVRERSRLLVGPWTHGSGMHQAAAGDVDFGLRSSGLSIDLAEDLTGHHLTFFDSEMRGAEPAWDAPVRIFTMGRDRWRDLSDWPPPKMREEAWYLGGDASLSRSPSGAGNQPREFDHDPADPCPTHGGGTLMPPAYPRGPVDQTRVLDRSDVLLYTSEPLEEELELTGPVSAHLFASTSGRDCDWVLKLCHVRPDGRVFNICDGICREERPSGEFEIDLGATSIALSAGHRLGLIVTSSDHPRYDRNPLASASRQQIFSDPERPSRLILPVIG